MTSDRTPHSQPDPGDSTGEPSTGPNTAQIQTVSALFPGKAFISTVLEALDTKNRMTGSLVQRYLMRAGMAGMIVAIFYVTNFGLIAIFDGINVGDETLIGIGRALGGIAFGWALVFIYYTKSELLTSNMMVVSIGGYYRKISAWRGLKILSLCLLGNFLGGLLIALLYTMSTIPQGMAGEAMLAAVEHKLAYVTGGWEGYGDLFVRAILCNFMINLAMLLIYNGYIKDDITKALAMIAAVFVFAFMGLEHSVANTVLFTVVGLNHGIDVLAALANVGVALVGNFVGGGLMIGLYYAYVNDDSHYRPPRDLAS
ncbi:formate/nitrite transporter family protein [Kocuria sp.]|uniref:formate/nitrite transporter family protein n=1 Tax=Kocuria sp. TaxID=1871328 RepID=UPI0026E04789|nr:formate/nitrite transporter family protein [Kocuria sp.]MDO5618489.1 formate/nitrite transporter family protein [Kocuria sp.]